MLHRRGRENSAKESRVDNVANSEPLALRDGPWMDVGLLQKHIGYTLIPEVLQRWTDVGLERFISATCRSDAYPCERRNITLPDIGRLGVGRSALSGNHVGYLRCCGRLRRAAIRRNLRLCRAV